MGKDSSDRERGRVGAELEGPAEAASVRVERSP